MPSALCNAFGGQTTAYAVQNADQANSVTFQVRYKQTNQADFDDGPYTIGPGGKQSISGCGNWLPAGGNGSAVIERTGGAGTLFSRSPARTSPTSLALLGTVENQGLGWKLLPYVYGPRTT